VEVGGDVIIAVNGQTITSFDDILLYIGLHAKPGDVITFTIIRNGKTMDVDLILETRPDNING